MFNKRNDKQNENRNVYYTGYGMYPASGNGNTQNRPAAGAPARKDRKGRILSFLLHFNWLGLIGLALYIASVCTGHLYIILAVIAFVVSLAAFILRKKCVGNFFAYAGLVLSSMPVGIIVLIVWGIAAGSRRARRLP